MKKFFRMVSMFVLAGATLAYTGCTDYDEDIEAINDRIDMLETGKLKTVEEQVASLNTTVKNLQDAQSKAQSAIEALQSTLGELKTKHDADIKKLEDDYKAADASLKTSIENQIKTLTDQFNSKVAELNTAISGLQSSVDTINGKISSIEATIKTLATKEYVDATFATKQAVAVLETELGKLSARLEIAEKSISTISTDVENLKKAVEAAQKAADDAQTAADKAQETADAALGTVNALVEALGAYSVQGALEAKIAALMEMDEELDEKKFNTADFHDTFTKEFDAAIAAALANGGVINKEIARQVAEAKSELDKKIDAVEKALNARIDKVLGVIEGRLTSIAFVPQYYYDGVPAILFETIGYDGLSDVDEEAVNGDHYYEPWNDQTSEYANRFAKFASAIATAKYRLNPRNVGADCADFSFVGDKADYVYTRSEAPAAPVSIVGVPSYDEKTGYVIFQVAKNEKINVTDNENKKLDIVALKAVLKKGLTENEEKEGDKPEVYSEYAHVNEVVIPAAALAISDSALLASPVASASLPEEADLKKFDFVNGHEYAKTFTAAKEGGYVYEMPYDKDFDLGSLVATCLNYEIWTNGLEGESEHEALNLEKYGLTYRFSVAKSPYEITDLESVVDQQKEIVCLDSLKGIFGTVKVKDAEGKDVYATARVGRMPIVRVDLMHGDNIVTRAFIKLVITGKRQADYTENAEVLSAVLGCPDKVVENEITEDALQAIYDALHIDAAEFWAVYGVEDFKTEVLKNDKKNTDIPAPIVDVAKKTITWSMTHEQAGKIGNGAKIVTTVTLTDKRVLSALPKHITFKFEVNFTLPKPVVSSEIQDIYWKDSTALKANVNVPLSTTDVAENCKFSTPIALQPWKTLTATNLPCAATDLYNFRVSKVYTLDENGNTVPVNTTNGVFVTPTNGVLAASVPKTEYYIKLDKSDDAVKVALNSEFGLYAEVEWYATAQSGDEFVLKTFLVSFIRPLNFTLPTGLEVTDAVTGGDVVAFQDKAMLTDWRGEVVFGPEYNNVVLTDYFWNKVCSPADHAEYQPSYQKELTKASFSLETETIKLNDEEVYYVATYQLNQNAEVIAWFNKYGDAPLIVTWDKIAPKVEYRPKGTWNTVGTITGEGRTESEAKANARAKVNELNSHYLDGTTTCGYSAELIGTESKVSTPATEITVVTNVIYTPATYVTVEGGFVYSPCNPKPGPAQNGEVYTEGQRIGCWEYQKYQWEEEQTVPGQYWDFYGKIDGYVTLDLDKAWTSLENGEFPSGAELIQTGNTVKYVNVMSPIHYVYYIYIPASIKYGWGTLNQTLVIKVNPVGTIAK